MNQNQVYFFWDTLYKLDYIMIKSQEEEEVLGEEIVEEEDFFLLNLIHLLHLFEIKLESKGFGLEKHCL